MKKESVQNIKVSLIKGASKIQAVVSFTIGPIGFNSWKIIDGSKGFFVAPPSQKGQDGTYFNLIKFTDKEAQAVVQEAILDVYHTQTKSTPSTPDTSDDPFDDDDLPF